VPDSVAHSTPWVSLRGSHSRHMSARLLGHGLQEMPLCSQPLPFASSPTRVLASAKCIAAIAEAPRLFAAPRRRPYLLAPPLGLFLPLCWIRTSPAARSRLWLHAVFLCLDCLCPAPCRLRSIYCSTPLRLDNAPCCCSSFAQRCSLYASDGNGHCLVTRFRSMGGNP
jgi:hypothetical protein